MIQVFTPCIRDATDFPTLNKSLTPNVNVYIELLLQSTKEEVYMKTTYSNQRTNNKLATSIVPKRDSNMLGWT